MSQPTNVIFRADLNTHVAPDYPYWFSMVRGMHESRVQGFRDYLNATVPGATYSVTGNENEISVYVFPSETEPRPLPSDVFHAIGSSGCFGQLQLCPMPNLTARLDTARTKL